MNSHAEAPTLTILCLKQGYIRYTSWESSCTKWQKSLNSYDTNFNKRPKMSQSTRAKIQKKKKAQQLQLQCDYCEEVMNTSFKVEKI